MNFTFPTPSRCLGAVLCALSVGANSAPAFKAATDDADLPTLEPGSKISETLRQAVLAGADELDVIVYVARPAPYPGAPDPVEVARAPYKAQLRHISNEIRTLLSQNRPMYSMTEAQELAYEKATAHLPLRSADEARLAELERDADETRNRMHKAVVAALQEAGAAERSAVADVVAAGGGQITAELTITNALVATIPTALINTIAAEPLVIAVQPSPPVKLLLNVSGPVVGWPAWHAAGEDGSATFDLGIVDTGVQQDHPSLSAASGFFTSSPTGEDPDGHGTHVTGIVASDHSCPALPAGCVAFKGGAPNLDAIIWEHLGTSQGETMAAMHNLVAGFEGQSPEAVNYSLGTGHANVTDYPLNDSFYDKYIDHFEIQIVAAAGNDGWTTPAPDNNPITITAEAAAYNLLAVANMDDRNTSARGDDVRHSSSSVGPTVNGRRKPDIAAPGTNIVSTNNNWPGDDGTESQMPCGATNTDNFCSKTGTSMAAPHVTASIILLEDGGNLVPAAQKAVLLNTADPWDSNNTASTTDDRANVAPTCPGGTDPCATLWDKSYGWGYLDMTEARFNRVDFFEDTVIARNDTAIEDDYRLYKGEMLVGEKATLTWHKRADTYNEGAAAGVTRQLGDLDLHLYANEDGDVIDRDTHALDNVAQVVSTEPGQKIVKVEAFSTIFDGIVNMPFALATEENFVAVDPPSFAVSNSMPTVGAIESFIVGVEVLNTGQIGAHNTSIAIGTIPGVDGGAVAVPVGTIHEGLPADAEFTLTTVGLADGSYDIPVTVTSQSYDETYTQEFPAGVQIEVDGTPPMSECAPLPEAVNSPSIDVPFFATDFGAGVDIAELYAGRAGEPLEPTGLEQAGDSGFFAYTAGAGDGLYEFAVRARDLVGNWEEQPFFPECGTLLDTQPPDSSVTSPLSVAAGTVPLSFSAVDPAPSSELEHVELWYFAEPAGPWQPTGLSDDIPKGVADWLPPGPGIYHFLSQATDRAGNVEPETFGPPPADSVTNYGLVDTDGDGVPDLADNCRLVANATQRDTNGDGIGNTCDPDINNDCLVNFLDVALYRASFFMAGDLDTDNNGDGMTNFVDLAVAVTHFFGKPGPGALGSCAD